ncbi:hypothetical protein DERP_008141 [Dermatophagoides pteronyssinus]|uniref:Uncharacterized protein n=1 Tax=Dermatophagoides pteronyssinus TaxID=6956 RepID=A0ABQ8JJU8_DERPT|nr:hypothetical protein DERP_008141 [Dermatophagoides pteronyssinus]
MIIIWNPKKNGEWDKEILDETGTCLFRNKQNDFLFRKVYGDEFLANDDHQCLYLGTFLTLNQIKGTHTQTYILQSYFKNS